MNTSTEVINDKITHLTEDAETLIHTARDFASQQTEEISNHLADGSAHCKDLYHSVRSKGIMGGQVVSQDFHAHSLRYLSIIAGIGVVLGFVLASRYRYHSSVNF